jgi:hypothetical protein
MITEDFIQLLGGNRRYLSLSHQYIEWVQKLYSLVLQGEEFSYDRLLNSFYFPPGQAAYISRVLKGRNNVELQVAAKINLIRKLTNDINEYDQLIEDEQRKNQMRQLILTTREYQILDILVAKLIIQGTLQEKHQITDRLATEGYRVAFLIGNIRIILNNLN